LCNQSKRRGITNENNDKITLTKNIHFVLTV